MHLNNSKIKSLALGSHTKELFWKILAWLSIAVLGFIGYASRNVYDGAMDGREAKIENVKQQQQLDSVCSRTMIHDIYIHSLQQQNVEYKQDIKEIKGMLIDIYKTQRQ